jgi:hypothetical protein
MIILHNVKSHIIECFYMAYKKNATLIAIINQKYDNCVAKVATKSYIVLITDVVT